jgi:ribosomal protein L16 Arg81 hydroxylase
MNTTPGRSGLSHLVDPVGPENFLSDYWERQPLVIHRDDPDHFGELLTLEQLDRILSTTNMRSADLRVVENGAETAISELVKQAGGSANGLEALYSRYREGATVSVSFLHERWEPLKRLCQSLAIELSAHTQTNVYLTPAGGHQGLVPHHDTHDVFVAQIHGVKHWCLYEPQMELPLEGQQFSKSVDPGPPTREFDLYPGDLLYLPRGTAHAATSKDTASCHLTIGVRPIVWATLIKDAVSHIVADDVRFRHALPPGFAIDADLEQQALATAEELFDLVRAQVVPADLLSEARRWAWVRRHPALHGHLLDIEALPSIGLDVWLATRPDMLWRLDDDGDQVMLEFHGKRVGFPAHVAPALRFIGGSHGFTGADIPGTLDETGRLVLIQTLVREGFLTLA